MLIKSVTNAVYTNAEGTMILCDLNGEYSVPGPDVSPGAAAVHITKPLSTRFIAIKDADGLPGKVYAHIKANNVPVTPYVAPQPLIPEIVPSWKIITALQVRGVITAAEKQAWNANTSVPPLVVTAVNGIASLTPAQRIVALDRILCETSFYRSHQFVALLQGTQNWSNAQMDEFWLFAASI